VTETPENEKSGMAVGTATVDFFWVQTRSGMTPPYPAFMNSDGEFFLPGIAKAFKREQLLVGPRVPRNYKGGQSSSEPMVEHS
jgi:hypothetical protein